MFGKFFALLGGMRIPRKFILQNNSLFHVTWQCHNKSWLLKYRWAKKLYYDLLLRFKEEYGMIFYSYIIMDNHIHLSGKLSDLKQFSRFFQKVNSIFAKEINKQADRCGQVIRDRFKSPQVETEAALMRLMVYQDLNEVRAGKAKHPKQNVLSSYGYYAYGRKDALITEPEVYKRLGSTSNERQLAYQGMVEEILSSAPRKRQGRYSDALFIGDPAWVTKQYKKLHELRQALARKRVENLLSDELKSNSS